MSSKFRIEAIPDSLPHWRRVRCHYESRVSVFMYDKENRKYLGSILRKLGFVSYHLIKRIHGEKALIKMATDTQKLFSIFNGRRELF